MRYLFTLLCIAALLPGSYSFATEYTFEIEWALEEATDIELAGFRLYGPQQKMVCETANPAASTMACTVDIETPTARYSLVSYSASGVESDPSEPFTVIFEDSHPLEAIINLTTTPGSLTVDFDATASTGSIKKYSWDFSDGSQIDNNATPSHTFHAPGTYSVTLTVQDDSNDTASISREITVNQDAAGNQPPSAALVVTSAILGDKPLTVTFDASDSTDPENSELTYFWNFGDGTTSAGSKLASHQYTVAGTYTATVTVTDNQGASASTSSQPIMVGEGKVQTAMPTARISASKTSAPAPVAVTFNGAASTPSERTGSISQYSWNFGDGLTASGKLVKHTFSDPGSYTIQLTVTDSSGKQATTTTTLTARAAGMENINPTLLHVYKLLLLKN